MLNNNAKKWVAALRSGKFKQGRSYLQMGDNYCCLGVACVIAKESGVYINMERGLDKSGASCWGNDIYELPSQVRDWLNLSTDIGTFRLNTKRSSLVDLNDDGKTFLEIADIIESEPKGLFKS